MYFKHLKNTKILAVVSSCVIIFSIFVIVFLVFANNRTVGYVTDNKIYYKDQTYIESYDVFDFDVGKCLGKVEWKETRNYTKLYSIKNHPEYIYLSMTTDYRIYKAIN